jgi:hypothetical protein
VFVARPATSGVVAAPWAKVGSVAAYDLVLGNEDSNNWAGWFDATNALTSNGLQKAAGTVLEGLVDATAVWGTAPASMRLAFAAYTSPDGGALVLQTPCGDGDGVVEAAEFVSLTPLASDVPPSRPDGVKVFAVSPRRGGIFATIESVRATDVRIELFDVRGRRLRHWLASRPRTEITTGRLPAGVYVLRARDDSGTTSRRVVIVD